MSTDMTSKRTMEKKIIGGHKCWALKREEPSLPTKKKL